MRTLGTYSTPRSARRAVESRFSTSIRPLSFPGWGAPATSAAVTSRCTGGWFGAGAGAGAGTGCAAAGGAVAASAAIAACAIFRRHSFTIMVRAGRATPVPAAPLADAGKRAQEHVDELREQLVERH